MTMKAFFLRKTSLIPVAVILLYTLVGFFLLPIVGKNILMNKLSTLLNREVFIEKIFINPYTFTSTIDVLIVKEKNKAATENNKDVFFSADKISADLSFFSLFAFTLGISDISLESPYVSIVQNQDGSFNFSDLLNSGKQDETLSKEKDKNKDKNDDQKSSGELINFVLKNVNIVQGEIRFKDKANDVSHLMENFSLSLPLLSSRQKNRHEKSKLDIGFTLNQSKTDIHVESTPFAEDLATQVDIRTLDIDLIHYLSYLSMPENIRLKKMDLNLDINLDFHAGYSKADSKNSLVVQGTINALNAIVNGGVEEEIIKIPLLTIDISPSDVLANQLNISKILMATPQLNVNRDKAGKINLLDYFSKNNENLKEEKKEDKKTANAGHNFFSLNLEDFEIKDAAVSFQDFSNETAVKCTMNFLAGAKVSQKSNTLNMTINTPEFSMQSLVFSDQQSKEEMINIPEFKIKGAVIDVGNKKIDTGTITARNGNILLKRDKDGQINIVKSVMPVQESRQPANTAGKTTAVSSGEKESLWDVTMNSFDATGFAVQFNDLTNTDPVKIDLSNISINAADLKTQGEQKGRVAVQMDWGREGRISIKGNAVPSMLSAGLDVNLKKIDIKSLQPYFTNFVRVLVTDGHLNTKGTLDLDMRGTRNNNITFAGETSLTNFICLDKKTATDFFKCNSLYFSGLDVSLFPVKVTVKDISLTDFYSRIIVSNTGEINLNTIFKQDTPEDHGKGQTSKQESKQENKQKTAASETPQIRVDSITLQGGDISFSDYLTQPNFTAGMKQIAGSVTGLSSDEQSRAKLSLKGLHGNSSPLDIAGTINPLAAKKIADINISFKDIELVNFTPYSSRYLGYKIEKGKLILDLEYTIDGSTLKSENRVQFDNFFLGERVESKDATSLPVGLAISLLKNRDGRINLDLPVSGQLDDPEFKIGSIVLKMISNLILKVVTSPFSIIGAMFGGGEDLGFVEFEYGDSAINPSDYEKLDKLAQILQEKTSINLEIQGIYDNIRDAEVLRKKGFEDLIKAEQIKELSASGSDTGTLKDVVILKEDLQYYIDMAYAVAKFPKPRDEAGNEKEIGMEEKTKLLMTNINVGKDDLRLLSMKRSENIKAYLLSTGKVEKERIFLLEPLENESSNTDRTSEVKFLLK
ncbi:DUF748 domain-containing protein [Desulfobacula phenolica]|uniref:DUF748 domain-containing protein n=1 Tax=Desulfobacula phenolica TaxID=90732 RepID=A0A1H2K4D0_9BACT|nr:DUF748 domain-containing protein [Desulfobacula phenolica]SDU63560.1 protein of unknown function [Desulfobacula phenolica]